MNDSNDWKEGDAVWDLLGKAEPAQASGRFAADTLRAVKLLPEADPWWPKLLRFSPWVAAAACTAFAAIYFASGPERAAGSGASPVVALPTAEEQWVQIEEVAEAEMLAAAADHLDRFSDQELVSLIGF